MAGLVDYPSTSEDEQKPSTPPAKKRKVSTTLEDNGALPPLPASFLDQYSSTVRTSAQDDPSLHGGRKRGTPHVQGSWPAHVYLEWHPNTMEAGVLADVLFAVQNMSSKYNHTIGTAAQQDDGSGSKNDSIHSLLENELGVALPLHISLSRPLMLKTENKDVFVSRLQKAIKDSNVRAFDVQPKDLAWHSNENSTRWFLVLRLQRSADEEITRLLATCNDVASDFGQPLLYAGKDKRRKALATSEVGQKFHISVAWSLEAPTVKDGPVRRKLVGGTDEVEIPYELLGRLVDLSVQFGEVKVRIGQDVHTVPLKTSR